MKTNKPETSNMLSKYEIACLTAGVPASGDSILDGIITQGLRFKVATELLASNRPMMTHKLAIRMTDDLIEEFRKGKNVKEST